MPKTSSPTPNRRVKNIKNVYIQKINSLFKLTGAIHPTLSCLYSCLTTAEIMCEEPSPRKATRGGSSRGRKTTRMQLEKLARGKKFTCSC